MIDLQDASNEQKVAYILQELFNFDGQIEDLCCMSETEGVLGMPADEMIDSLKQFIADNL